MARTCASQTRPASGIRFAGSPAALTAVERDMQAYLKMLGIAPHLVEHTLDLEQLTLGFALTTDPSDTDTLSFQHRREFGLEPARVELPLADGTRRTVHTTSNKEIVLALLQHGRLTEFRGPACDIDALRDHVGMRQNIAAWAEQLEWVWPDGGPARWNERYWNRGIPRPDDPLHEALLDVFTQQQRYTIGCYTASKLVYAHAVLDYYRRVKRDAITTGIVQARLMADDDPLVDLEPRRMWDFEADFDASDRARPGKILDIRYGVAPRNFVPGDWSYFLNTDPVSRTTTGFEGSSSIYLGRNRFVDFYNGNNHAWSYREKLDQVYQWKYGVPIRSPEENEPVPLTDSDVERLGRTPAEGGLLLDLRAAPYFFGFQALPEFSLVQP